MNPGVLRTATLLTLMVAILAMDTCPNFEKFQQKCKCIKNPEYNGQISLDCENINSQDLFGIFETLRGNGDNYYELICRNSDLSEVKELPDSTHQLKFLKFVHVTGLTDVTLKGITDPLTDLEHLTVDGGNLALSTVHRDLFGQKPSLKILNLNEIKIEKIAEDAFDHLQNLEVLSLEGNLIKDIPSSAFGLQNLRELFLNRNQIKTVSDKDASKIDDKNVDVFLNTFDCSCDSRDTAFVKLVQDKQLTTFTCSTPEDVNGKEIKNLKKEEFCSKGTSLISSLVLVVTLLFALVY